MDKKFHITNHAETSLRDRSIEKEVIISTIQFPDAVSEGYDGRKVFSKKYYDGSLSQEMLVRAIVEESSEEFIVITVYKVSRISRYLL
jgi:hypothetical protein